MATSVATAMRAVDSLPVSGTVPDSEVRSDGWLLAPSLRSRSIATPRVCRPESEYERGIALLLVDGGVVARGRRGGEAWRSVLRGLRTGVMGAANDGPEHSRWGFLRCHGWRAW